MEKEERRKQVLAETRNRTAVLNKIAIAFGWSCWSSYETAVYHGLCAPTKRAVDLRQRAPRKNKKVSGANH